MSRVSLIVGAGQSNMSGRGELLPGDPLDEPHPAIWQFGAHRRVIEPASVPLDMHDASPGLSPLTVFAHRYVEQHPDETVLLVPAAHGGTGFSTTSAEPVPTGFSAGAGTWTLGRDEPVNLAHRLLDQISRARRAASAHWGNEAVPTAFLWHQGESDTERRGYRYGVLFDELAHRVRDALDVPDIPLVVGGMVPEWVAAAPFRAQVHQHHVDTPRRLVRAAFAPARPGTGREGDVVHFTREGVIALGESLYGAYRSLVNS